MFFAASGGVYKSDPPPNPRLRRGLNAVSRQNRSFGLSVQLIKILMDKKSIIGIAVVAVLFLGFAYINSKQQKEYLEKKEA